MTPAPPHVLVVDDDDVLRTVFSRLLERSGFVAFTAEGAESATLLLEEHPMDLVMLDNHMPDTSGVELIRQIRCERPKGELPILLVSGSSHIAEIEQAMSYGANAFLRKPVGVDELIPAARRLIEESSAAAKPSPLKPAPKETTA